MTDMFIFSAGLVILIGIIILIWYFSFCYKHGFYYTSYSNKKYRNIQIRTRYNVSRKEYHDIINMLIDNKHFEWIFDLKMVYSIPSVVDNIIIVVDKNTWVQSGWTKIKARAYASLALFFFKKKYLITVDIESLRKGLMTYETIGGLLVHEYLHIFCYVKYGDFDPDHERQEFKDAR